jgi:acetoacetyl-CoA synthetase
VLFVRLRDGMQLDKPLSERIRRTICDHATARHVPSRIVQAQDIPRTKRGKLVELAVRNTVQAGQ